MGGATSKGEARRGYAGAERYHRSRWPEEQAARSLFRPRRSVSPNRKQAQRRASLDEEMMPRNGPLCIQTRLSPVQFVRAQAQPRNTQTSPGASVPPRHGARPPAGEKRAEKPPPSPRGVPLSARGNPPREDPFPPFFKRLSDPPSSRPCRPIRRETRSCTCSLHSARTSRSRFARLRSVSEAAPHSAARRGPLT